jgi:hypothetical protein
MADPVIVACPKDAWTKVATNVTNGQVHKLDVKAFYLRQYVDTGGSAPTDLTKAIRFDNESLPLSFSGGADVYLYCKRFAGSVRVDL